MTDAPVNRRWVQLLWVGAIAFVIATVHLYLERTLVTYPRGPISRWLYTWLHPSAMLLFVVWSFARDRDVRLFLKLLAAVLVASWLTVGLPNVIVFKLGGGGFF